MAAASTKSKSPPVRGLGAAINQVFSLLFLVFPNSLDRFYNIRVFDTALILSMAELIFIRLADGLLNLPK